MKTIVWILISLVSGIATAQEKPKNKNAKSTIEVMGNCKMCKKRIQTAAYGLKGVKYANWDVESKKLEVIIDETKTSLEEVQQTIATNGHDNYSILKVVKAPNEAYQQIHECCQYDRK